ncbi:MAG: hypothetical protein Tsb0018_00490 [Opitutales bacterium]|mgnify:CR=1 FL=1|tara:strand:- start:736 stop:1566 length:831 start_codon:yes stop_codon:yes gene_type:complete
MKKNVFIFLIFPVFCFLGKALISAEEDVLAPFSTITRGSFRSVLIPKYDIRLSSQSEGVVSTYDKQEGDKVNPGDVILSLDSRLEEAELGRAEAVLKAAEAEKIRAQKDFKRVESLFRENIASDKQFNEVVFLQAQAESHYLEAVEAVEMARIRLDQRYVRSPIAGIFFKKSKEIGESVGRYEVVARVVDVSSLEMVLFLGPDYFGKFSPDDSVTVELLDGPGRGKTVIASVDSVDSLIDPASGTFRVKLKLESSATVTSGIAARLLPDSVSKRGN